MCDTLVAMQNYTSDGSILFGKNSDREPDEAHEVVRFPAVDYPPNQRLQTTYLSIPQARHTFEVILAKPFWMWGCEMGVNENGVVVGNEAMFLKIRVEKKPGLIGMDLMRLALERSETAEEGIRVITNLLETYGQGGACGYRDKKFTYHNSFLIADFTGAYVLETFGREWAVKKVTGAYSISNCTTLKDDYDEISQGLQKSNSGRVNLKKHYEGFFYTYFSGAKKRRSRSMEMMAQKKGSLTPKRIAQILRDHGEHAIGVHPADLSNATLCMHAADPIIRKSQTVGSLIVQLTPDRRINVFATGTSAACLSIFKPIFFGCSWNNDRVGDSYWADSLWWQHETLHRSLLNRSSKTILDFWTERTEFEESLWKGMSKFETGSVFDQCLFSKEFFKKSHLFESQWIKKLNTIAPQRRFFYSTYWGKLSRRNGVPMV